MKNNVQKMWWKESTLFIEYSDGTVYAYEGARIKDINYTPLRLLEPTEGNDAN
jgi:hypothetical protein